MDAASKYARRVSGLTPFYLTGPASTLAAQVKGTFANCSGGKTLWNTVLSAEENYEDTCEAAGLDERHYEWIVEVDPFNPEFKVRKHTALGRFHHENAGLQKMVALLYIWAMMLKTPVFISILVMIHI